MKPKVVFLPHANIQYSQLKLENRKWVIENCYRKLFDLVDNNQYKIGFEASGKTIEEMHSLTPDVMNQLVRLIDKGLIEPVASPYAHIMMANVTKDIALDSLMRGLNIWERYTGIKPKVGWNPECSWNSDIPDIYYEAGIETLIMDADSFFLSFPDIRKATGLSYDVKGHSNKNKLPAIEEYISNKPEYIRFLTNGSTTGNGLHLMFRSDMTSNPLLWFLMGQVEGDKNGKVGITEVSDLFYKWIKRVNDTGSFLLPYAEDAEYIGSTAYFYVKQFNQAKFFEPDPSSIDRFDSIVQAAVKSGFELSTPSEAMNSAKLLENNSILNIENGVAWHGGTAKAWQNTDQALLLDPTCRMIYDGIIKIADFKNINWNDNQMLKSAFRSIEDAWISDSRWPPYPTSPGRFNVREALEAISFANDCIENAMIELGVDEKKSLYSPKIMTSQIKFIDNKLMNMNYFEEV